MISESSVSSNGWHIIEMEVARQQIFGSENCDVRLMSLSLLQILVILLPNNGCRLVFLFMSDWKRNILVVYDRTCIHDGFVQPASADLCLKLACRHSIMAFFTKGEMVISSVFLVIMWFNLFSHFPPTLYNVKSLQLMIARLIFYACTELVFICRKRISQAAVD